MKKTTIHVVSVLIIVMANWHAELFGVKGDFFHGESDEGTAVYMEIPEGFDRNYGNDAVLLLLRTIYGWKQAACAAWCILVQIFADIRYMRSKVDPCLYYAWTAY
jgi:hypothetical protein